MATTTTTTARAAIELRLGRPLGPLATMPRDLRDAVYMLALQLAAPRGRNWRPVRAVRRRGFLPA
jgi:hypothetical protein